MKRELAGFTAVLLITASTTTTAAASEHSDPLAAGLRDGMGQIADWYAAELPQYDRFGQKVPLIDVVPGVDTAISAVFSGPLSFASGNDLGALPDVDALAAAVSGEVALDAGLSFAVEAEPVDDNGLRFAVTIRRELDDVGFAVSRDAADGVSPVGIGSPTDDDGDVVDGVPVTLTFETAMTVRYTPDDDQFWIEADPGPTAVISAAIDSDRTTPEPDPFTVGAEGLPAAVGILDATVAAGSTLALDAEFAATLHDTDDDGMLQFDEKPDDGGTNVIPGEMRFALEDLIGTVTRTGSADGTFTLESSTVTIGDGADALSAEVGVDGPDLGAAEPVVSTDATYDDVFADFLSVDASELLGGLGQLFLATSVVQGHPAADIQLPFLGVSLRGIASPADGLAEFVTDQTVEFDPGNPEASQFGQARFTTIGQLVDRLTAEDDGVPGLDASLLEPVYDPETQVLDLRITIDNSLGDEAPITDQDGDQTGWLDFGDTLRADAGIDALQHRQTQAAPARARTGGSVDLLWTVDLQPGDTSCDDPDTPDVNECDDPDTPTITETEQPAIYERFGLRESENHEIEVLSEVRVPASGSIGTAGWVEVRGVGGEIVYRPAAGAEEPAVTVDLLLDGGHQSIHSFLQALTAAEEGQPPPVAADHLAVERDLGVEGSLQLRVVDAEGEEVTVGAGGTAGVSLTWPTAHDPDTSPEVTTTDSRAALLKALDYDLEHRTALFGRVVDTVDGLLGQVQQIGSDGAIATEALQTPMPIVERSLGSLAREATALSDTIDGIRTAGPPGSLQAFEKAVQDRLAELLGSGAETDLDWEIADLEDDGTPDLVVTIGASSTYADDVPVSLPVPGTGDLFGGTQGSVSLEVGAGLDLGFPVDVSDATLPDAADLRIRESSGLDVTGTAALGEEDSLGVAVAGVDVQLGPGGEAKLDAGVEVGVDGAGDGFVPAGTWMSQLNAQLQPSGQTCTTSTVPAETAKRTVTGQLACVNLPILVDGEPIDPADPANSLLQVTADDLGAPVVDAPDDLSGLLAGQLLSLAGLGDVFGQVSTLLNRVFDATEWGSKIPFIGKHLTGSDKALGEVGSAFDNFTSALTDPIEIADEENGAAAAALTPSVADLRTHLEKAAAELPADLLVAFDTEDDVKITLRCGSNECADESDTDATNVSAVEVEFSLGQGDVAGDPVCSQADQADCLFELPFDLGLPGLPLRTSGDVNVGGGWRVDLGFGISRDRGAYLLDDPRSSMPDGGTDPAHMVAKLQASLNGELAASLGIFSAAITSDEEASGVRADFSASLPSGDADGRILVGELVTMATSDLSGSFDPTFDVSAGIKLDFTAGAGDVGLPGLETSLCYGFPSSNCDGSGSAAAATQAGEFDPAAALVQFDGVYLNLGDVLQSMLGEPLRFVGDITEPIEPVLDFLTAPIPVISDLSRLFGGPDVTMLSLARLLGMDDSTEFVASVSSAVRLADSFAGGAIKVADTVTLDAERAGGNRPAPDQAFDALTDDISGMIGTVDQDGEAAAAVEANKAKVADTPQSWVTAPVLENPGCLVTTIFGQDCDIVRWEPPPLKVEFAYDQAFGPFFGVLYVSIGGWAGAGARFGAGLSTAGIREALDQDSSVVDSLAFALHGLYVIDFDDPELFLEAGIKAGGKIDAVVAAAGVDGGVAANLGFDLRDPVPDGRVHTTEIGQKIFTPLCMFDIAGKLTAFLEAWARLGVSPFSVRKTFKLAEVTLFDFTAALQEQCEKNAAPPVLASTDDDETWDFGARGTHHVEVLRLNMGAHASDRGAFTDVTDESFTVRELAAPVWDGDTPVSPGRYQVSAFGHSQEKDPDDGRVYEGYAVVLDAADGHDNVVFSGGQSVDITDEQGLDQPATSSFSAAVWGDLGPGNDVIQTGDGDDRIAGGQGTDDIVLGRGGDRGHGDSQAGLDGLFTVSASTDSSGAADVVDGADGDDVLFGGGGDDEVNAGPGSDTINAGGDSDVAYGDDGVDTVTGGLGADTLYGGDGNDTVHGDTAADADDPNATGDPPSGSADTVFAGPGRDRVFAGAGGDTVHGEPGNDTVFGQWGADTVDGSDGHDLLAGGPGDDAVTGAAGHDKIWGDARPDPDDDSATSSDDATSGGGDTIDGGPGSDFVDGGGGSDVIGSGPGDDGVTGGWGDDTIRAGDDADLVAGDVAAITGVPTDWSVQIDDDGAADDTDAEDRIFGDAGDDTVYGQSRGDEIHGGLDDDVIRGNAGEDEIWGDGGDDEIHGNVHDDVAMAGPGDDLAFGGPGSDELYGHAGTDRLVGGSVDSAAADAGDVIYGGAGEDVALGDNGTVGDVLDESTIVPANGNEAGTFGDDHMGGGAGRDVLHGQDGGDRLFGDAGDDQLFGELGADRLIGGADHDTLLGDQGAVTPAAAVDPDGTDGVGRWPGGAPRWTTQLVAPDEGGEDDLFGRSGDDHVYGGWADDYLEGGPGDDAIEGNGGRDTMYGNEPPDGSAAGPMSAAAEAQAAADPRDADDMIGGSSVVNGAEAKLDEGEFLMFGNELEDVMAGDNAVITGVVAPGDSGATWAVDDVTGGRLRQIELLDREKSATTPIPLSDVSGPDLVHGNEGNDRMFGQGGTDILKGNEDDDFVQGNQDRDLIEGNGGEDDLVGGSQFLSPFVGTPDEHHPDQGDHDAGDEIYGGAGADVAIGDNGDVTRRCQEDVDYTYATTQLGIENQRCIQLLDLQAPPAEANFGPDVISGGAGVDVLFGQDADDVVAGGPDDDYMEGNGGTEWLFGDSLASGVKTSPPSVTLPYETLPADAQDELALPTPGTLEFPPAVPFFDTCPLDDDNDDNDCRSAAPELEGPAGPDGQDDQIGGSSRSDHRDSADVVFGDGAADFQLGDNGRLDREIVDGAYSTYADYNPTTVVREATRYDVAGPPHTHGRDVLIGDGGDDYQWGQDGNDALLGQQDNDEQYGELGGDWVDGARGQDVQIGDRGGVVSRLLGPGEEVTATTGGPTFFDIVLMREGTFDRRVDLQHDADGSALEHPGLTSGGDDIVLGGPGHDVMHGAFADDAMNGNGGGDWMYGDDGADVMWGGRGCVPGDPEDGVDDSGAPCAGVADPGEFDQFVDILFGGHGGTSGDEVGDADILDFRPRAGVDPPLWHLLTGTLNDDASDPDSIEDNDHHHGVDWIYGGWDRDVLQGDIGQNGPEPDGDRLIDWVGAFNLFTRCNASYGDDGDIRQRSPQMETLLQTLAFGTGVGTSMDDVRDPDSSAYRELALVYKTDTRENNGRAFPGTPGHFDEPSCLP
ncbi:calcium-binding protein [Haloactinopolyspora alba]|nr:calcium-binding protein [Haloactinopolyspora alba]